MNSNKDQNNSKFSRVHIWFFPIWWSSVPSLHWTPAMKCLALILYRHTSLYLSLLPFYTLKVCDGLLSSNFSQYYLSTAFVHLMSLCCTLVILTIILKFFILIIFVMMICDQWSLMLPLQKNYDSLKAHEDSYHILAQNILKLIYVDCFLDIMILHTS